MATVTTYSVQERTAKTMWRTESVYGTRDEAERVVADLERREPTNDDGEEMFYRVLES
jgi:hypothetical protein